jgi:2,4-dienoyl-CoA reductase-like NADH-dependent reductase (Old Yellow Enzyme family)
VAEIFRPMTSVPLIVNTGFDKAKANAVLEAGNADLVAFGVPCIANPDLVERFRTNAPLNKPDPSTFHGVGPQGCTDYPALEARSLSPAQATGPASNRTDESIAIDNAPCAQERFRSASQ